MPSFSFQIEVPKNTTRSDPLEHVHKIPSGILTEGTIVIPKGHKGLTGLRLFYLTKQIAPANTGGFFAGNDTEIPVLMNTRIDRAPYQLVSESWNTDTGYDHTFLVAFNMKTRGNPSTLKKHSKRRRKRLTDRQIKEIVEDG